MGSYLLRSTLSKSTLTRSILLRSTQIFLQIHSCIPYGIVITNCHQSYAVKWFPFRDQWFMNWSKHKDENADAGSWNTAGPKTMTGEAKGEMTRTCLLDSILEQWLLRSNEIQHRTSWLDFIYRSVPQIRRPFCKLSLSTKRRGSYKRDATFSLAIMPSLDREIFSGSVDAGFVLALPFPHGDLGGAYARDKNTFARLCAKNAGGAYLRDTTVHVHQECMMTSFFYCGGRRKNG